MSSTGELACTYACLILRDDGIPVTAEKIGILVQAANLQVESYWLSLFAKLCEKKNMEELIMNVGSASTGEDAPTAPATGDDAAIPPAAGDKKKEEEEAKEESDDEAMFSLFD